MRQGLMRFRQFGPFWVPVKGDVCLLVFWGRGDLGGGGNLNYVFRVS